MPSETIMPFGQFRGRLVIDIPASRCEWLLTKWEGRHALGKSLRLALARRVQLKSEETRR